MAGGPIFPSSAYPEDVGSVWAAFYEADGANHKHTYGLAVEDAPGSDVTWALVFHMPPTLPSGTGKLRLIAQADAISGAAKVNPKWASVAMGEDPSSATLNAEGTSTVTWSTDDDDEYQELKITLDADTLVGGEIVVMDLVFETTGFTLAVDSVWQASIIWE